MAAHTAVIRVSPAIDRGYLFSLLHINEVGERDNQRGRDMLSAEVAGQVRDSVPEPEAVKVFFVEDDTDFREALAGELSDHGFAIQCFGDGESLIAALEQCLEADLILLDWSLPRTSGIDLVQELRERGIELPVVFLTGHSPTLREAQAFDRGAIDFIDKVRGVDVLVRRLRRAAKMAKPPVPVVPTEQTLIFGKLVLRPSIGRVFWNGADVGLTLCEYKMISLLASNIGHQASYRAIYDTMHYQGFVAGCGDEGYRVNVRSAIKRIRKKFLKIDPGFDEIENHADFGYAWRSPPVNTRQ
jgi:two-component system response regulator ChvI